MLGACASPVRDASRGPAVDTSIETRTIGHAEGFGDAELQSAMLRWEQCLQRFEEPGGMSLSTPGGAIRERMHARERMMRACEGHRRDIAQRFPRHLESRIHARLEARAQRRAEPRLAAQGLDTDALIDTMIDNFPQR